MNEHYLSITYIAVALLAVIFLIAKKTRRREVQAEHHHHPHHTPEPAVTAEDANEGEDHDTKGDGDHDHNHHEEKVTWWKVTQWVVWMSMLIYFLFWYLVPGVSRTLSDSHRKEVIKEEAKRDPDSHEWVLSVREPYRTWQRNVATGIHRETNPLSHAVTLRWHSDELGGDIIATWNPAVGQCDWVCINSVGKKIYGDFKPQTVTDTVIIGTLGGEDPDTKTWKIKEFELDRVD